MPLSHIEHLLLLVEDVDSTVDWFVENIGLERGHTPDFKVPVTWLYIGERDVLHIAQVPSEGTREKRFQDRYLGGLMSDQVSGTGIIDHVAFRCTGLPEVIERLERNGVEFLQRQANDGDLYQLFVTGPVGMRVELNFDAAEAERHGIIPGMTAAEAVAP
jgi:4-hydroxyphenylpyruvate dioxygenase-like putative hemolysin